MASTRMAFRPSRPSGSGSGSHLDMIWDGRKVGTVWSPARDVWLAEFDCAPYRLTATSLRHLHGELASVDFGMVSPPPLWRRVRRRVAGVVRAITLVWLRR
jgi:hypothetical protein